MKGCIFNVQRFSLDDGPGIRTTVFFKGCSMHCPWCHNPESISFLPQLMCYPDRCTGCGRCVDVCPERVRRREDGQIVFDRARCTACGRCAEVCPYDALALCGYDVEAEDLLCDLLRDRPFFAQSGGGVTFSGGEVLCQSGFVTEMAQLCRAQGVHTALDTAGNVRAQALPERLLESVDLFLYDVKAVDEALHRRLTGSGNAEILAHLRMLDDRGARLWIRIPFVQGYTCCREELERMAALLAPLKHVERIELMPYHGYGEGKYAALGLNPACAGCAPPAEAVDAAVDFFRKRGLRVLKSGG